MAGKPDNPNIQGKVLAPELCTKSYTVGCTENFLLKLQIPESLPKLIPLNGQVVEILSRG